ncbi:MAG: glycoside hydrolase family 3 N-terminal domain-containing protein [bacterium]
MKKLSILIMILLLTLNLINAQNQITKPVYKDSSQPVDVRVENLLSQMTLEEKVAQMLCVKLEFDMEKLIDEGIGDSLLNMDNIKNGMGQYSMPSFSHSINRKPREHAELTNKIQKLFMEKSRLGIPIMFHEEALHGFNGIEATNYPTPLALAGSFNTELVHQVFIEAAKEARTRGTHEVLAPVVDLGRDPRWGRTEETYGEDPYLASRMGVAAVTGFQGFPPDLSSAYHVVSTLKHFSGHGSHEGGRNIAPPLVDDRTLRDVLLKSFKACVIEGKVKGIMPSYNEINGVPSHANKWLLTDLLRNEWNFDGIVVSDWFGIPGTIWQHHVAKNEEEAAMLAVNSGVDVDLPTIQSYGHLVTLVNEGKVDMNLIDRAVLRILKIKYELGLFDNPFVDPDEAEKFAGCDEHRKTALKIAEESIVLLKNEGNLLPLDISKYKKIAVIGPNGDRADNGNYANEPKQRISPLQGIKEKVGSKAEVFFSQGIKLLADNGTTDTVRLEDPMANFKRIEEAARVAEQSDIVLLFLGAQKEMQREAWADYHRGDNASLELRSSQNELVQAIQKTGKPIVVFFFNGTPLAFEYINKTVPAIFECWYLGQETGYAVANVLFGEVNPSAKLSISLPASSGQLPVYYNKKPSRFRDYIFDDSYPLYPFGYGLSYTKFKIDNVRLEKNSISKNESVRVFAEVTNTGNVAGKEVVQLYINDLVSSVTRPLKELKDFVKIELKPGETKTVELNITPDKLSFYDINMKYTVEPGEFNIMVGNSSRDIDLITVQLIVTE